jgi:calmodulin
MCNVCEKLLHPRNVECSFDEQKACAYLHECTGKNDKTGHIKRDTLVRIIKQDFGLTIDIEELINRIDSDMSGEIDYEEFKTLLS